MGPRHAGHDRQPQARAPFLAGDEGLEDSLPQRFQHARAVVPHGHDDFAVAERTLEPHPVAGFGRVAQQVENHALDLTGIRHDLQLRIRQVDVETASPRFELRRNQLGRLLERSPDVVQRRLRRPGTSVHQKVRDDAVEGVHFRLDLSEELGPFSGIGAVGRDGREELQSAQGIPDFVRDLSEHEPELLVPLNDSQAHAFHGPRETADLDPRLDLDRPGDAAPLDAKRHPAEPLQRLGDACGEADGHENREHHRDRGSEQNRPPQPRQGSKVVGAHEHREGDVGVLKPRETVLVGAAVRAFEASAGCRSVLPESAQVVAGEDEDVRSR